MDEKYVFGTAFSDRKNYIREVSSQYQFNGYGSSEGSSLLTEFHTFPKHPTKHSVDRIGWQLYFPNEDMRTSRIISKHVRCLEKHYTDFIRNYSPSKVERHRSFEFILSLARIDLFMKDAWPSFEDDLKERPDYTIACIGLAMYRFVAAQRDVALATDIPKINARINYFGAEIPIGAIDARYVGKLITIRGIITRVSQQYVYATWRTYKCKNCNDTVVRLQKDELWTCSNCHGTGGMEFSGTSVWNRQETHRNITIQRMPSSNSNRTVDVKVPEEVENSLVPGADVTVTGILKIVSTEQAALDMYLEAICMRTNGNKPAISSTDTSFNAHDLRAFREIQSETFPFKLLVQSICPNVKGMETIKAGLLLALFSTSCDTHVLLASTECDISRQLLKCCVSASPKGVLVNDVSQTIDLVVARFENDLLYRVAGPLVLSDLGHCCIERIDKLNDLQSLEKLLNNGETNTKHNAACNGLEVPARFTLLATALTSQGMFVVGKPFLDHFTLPRAFMERFALIFQMEDTIDSTDELVCPNGVRIHPETPSTTKCSAEIPLARKLKPKSGDHFDPLPIELMRKYIEYARQQCKPEFTEASTKLLESFFSQLYSMPQWLNITNGMKITQIQNMVRARARMDLSAEITTEHVMDTIRIVSRSWYDKYDTDDRNPSVQLPSKGQTAAKPATVRKFLDVLRNHSKQLNRKLYTLKDLRALISEVGVPGVEDEIVEKLNIQGYLLKKGAGRYELLV